MIEGYQGETLYYEIKVVDAKGLDVSLIGAEGVLSYKNEKGLEIRELSINEIESTVGYKFLPEETSTMQGIYNIEVKLKDMVSDIDMLIEDKIVIKTSQIPDYGIGGN